MRIDSNYTFAQVLSFASSLMPSTQGHICIIAAYHRFETSFFLLPSPLPIKTVPLIRYCLSLYMLKNLNHLDPQLHTLDSRSSGTIQSSRGYLSHPLPHLLIFKVTFRRLKTTIITYSLWPMMSAYNTSLSFSRQHPTLSRGAMFHAIVHNSDSINLGERGQRK